jgi:predicted metalloprotease with PDZ domain
MLILSTLSCSKKETNKAHIEYKVESILNDSLSLLQVDFDFLSDNDGLILLRYENESWGDNNIFDCIKKFMVSPEPGHIDFIRDSSLIKIKTSPSTINHIQYSIGQDFKGPPLNQYRYRPILDSTYFHVLGMRLFMIPEGVYASDSSKAKINIHWNKLPEPLVFHSSFGTEYKQNLEVIREDLYASFFVGGDFRRMHFEHDKDTVYFLTRGNWKTFNDKAMFDVLKETITSQRSFWNDPRTGMFSVSLIPTYEQWTATSKSNSVGGSGFSSSFISFASNNDGTTINRMKWLYNHELLHKWIGRTIINENEVEQYWFSEGFTDYYAYKLMLKNKTLNAAEFIDILNKEVIVPHHRDPVNTVPNAEMTFDTYWSNYAVYMKLPYRRGLLYAFLIDTEIKEQSNFSTSLDDLMRELFHMALKDDQMRFNESVFLKLLSKYVSHDYVKSDFDQYIINGELIDFKERLLKGITISDHQGIPTLKIEPEGNPDLEEQLKK